MLQFLPQLMDGLFLLLGDEHREIRIETDDILTSFLSEIKASDVDSITMNSMMTILLTLVHHNDRFIRLTAVTWIHELIILECWPIPYAKVLRSLLPCYTDTEKEVVNKAVEACTELVKSLEKNGETVELLPIIEVVCSILPKKNKDQSIICLNIISTLLNVRGKEITQNDHLRSILLNTLKEENDEVIDMDLRVLVKYVNYNNQLNTLITMVVDMLEEDEHFMEERGCLILRTLCKYLQTKEVFPLIASIIINDKNTRFASLLVQVLNIILLTSQEAADFCSQLRSCFLPSASKPEGQKLFDLLFPAWCLNPFSAIALCWLTENYMVAYQITQSLANEEITLSMLLQADKLVQLLESPVFVHVRLQLISVDSPLLAPLLQSLYGLLMILPQSSSYRLLQSRLSGITPLHVIMMNSKPAELTEDDKKRIELYKSVKHEME